MIEHKLAVNNDAKPVKQVRRKQSKEKLEFIISEVDKLIEAGVIRAVHHPTWVANPVVVPKPLTFKWRLCIDFTDLNMACPKDPFPAAVDRPHRRLHGCVRAPVFPGCLLRVPSDSDGGGG